MDDIQVKFKDALMPGLLIGLITIAISLVIHYTVSSPDMEQKLGYINVVIMLGLMIYYGMDYRKKNFDNIMGYGKAFVYLFYVALIITVLSSVYYYLLISLIDPQTIEHMLEASEQKLVEMNMNEEQIDQAMAVQEKFFKPLWLSLTSLFFGLIFNSLAALIAAIFVKKTDR